MELCSFLVTGVGGQGVILASRILGAVGLAAGYDVKTSEMKGVSQRRGEVYCHVRWGVKVFSPVTPEGTLDYLVAFELLEALRWVKEVSPQGTILVGDQKVPPVSATGETIAYPEEEKAMAALRSAAKRVFRIPALHIAGEMGETRVANVVVLGALSRLLEVPLSAWTAGLAAQLPAGLVDLNQRAFAQGRGWLEE